MTALPVYDSSQQRTPLVTEFRNLVAYRGLLRLLVTRDLTVRYKRSVLGVWWTLLNPLLLLAVMYMVFGVIIGDRFGSGGLSEPYVVYLLAGVVMMTFFSQSVLATGEAIANARGVLSKVYVPAEVFAFSTAVAGAVNFLITMLPLLVIQILTGVGVPWTVVLSIIPLLAMLAMVTGAGMLIAAAAVYFYDVLDLTRVFVQLLFYVTPVFWTVEILPERLHPYLRLNPFFSYMAVFRDTVYRGVMSPAWQWAVMLGSALAALILGVWAFSKSWRRLVAQL